MKELLQRRFPSHKWNTQIKEVVETDACMVTADTSHKVTDLTTKTVIYVRIIKFFVITPILMGERLKILPVVCKL